jgi:hypothetical protein
LRADQPRSAPQYFGMSEHDGPARFMHARIGPRAHDDFGSDAGGVAHGHGEERFLRGF